jgi:hypothetical protein
MKRLVLLLALSLLILGAVAGPAVAWYDVKPHTAYVTTYQAKGWDEWTGPGPFDTTHHKGAIPHGYKVVLGMTWIDSELGAKLAPVEFLHTFALIKVGGAWSRGVLDPGKTVRYWSPAYEWDAAAEPGLWAEDWWVPLGKLAKGTYTGWARERVLSSYPTWTDESGLVTDPIWLDKFDTTWKHTFTVK